jgi:hypothetical protein
LLAEAAFCCAEELKVGGPGQLLPAMHVTCHLPTEGDVRGVLKIGSLFFFFFNTLQSRRGDVLPLPFILAFCISRYKDVQVSFLFPYLRGCRNTSGKKRTKSSPFYARAIFGPLQPWRDVRCASLALPRSVVKDSVNTEAKRN